LQAEDRFGYGQGGLVGLRAELDFGAEPERGRVSLRTLLPVIEKRSGEGPVLGVPGDLDGDLDSAQSL